MSMNPDELVSFANMFSNRTGGPTVKKKSAAQRRRAKAKGLKNAAAIALGQPMGKKVKPSTSKSTGTKGSTGKSTGNGMTGSKSVVSNGKSVNTRPATVVTPAPKPKTANAGPYVLPPKKVAVPSAAQVKNSKAATTAIANRSAAYVALGQSAGVKKKAPKAGGLKTGLFMKSATSTTSTTPTKSANAGPYVMPPKKTTKATTGNGPSKLSPSRASSR